MKNMKVIVDTDPGIDDALAIMLLARSSLVDLLAISTVAGNASIENVTRNASFVLELVGCKSPVYSGGVKPLKKNLEVAHVHGSDGLNGLAIDKEMRLTGNSHKEIYRLIKKSPGEVSLICIGPLTNIAKLTSEYPDSASLLKQIIIMGGAINVAGNKNRVAEFNFAVDPHAAAAVLDSGAKMTLVPLDICNQTPLFLQDFEKLKGSILYEPIIKMVGPYIKAIKKFEGQNGALVYDALAAYYLLNPAAYTTEMMDVRVETEGRLTEGMSVADKRSWGQKTPNIDVVVGLDREKFLNDFVKLLG